MPTALINKTALHIVRVIWTSAVLGGPLVLLARRRLDTDAVGLPLPCGFAARAAAVEGGEDGEREEGGENEEEGEGKKHFDGDSALQFRSMRRVGRRRDAGLFWMPKAFRTSYINSLS